MGTDVFIHLNGVEDSTSFVEVERMWSSNPSRRRAAPAVRRAAAQAAHSTHALDCGTGARMTTTTATPAIRATLLFTPRASAFVPPAAAVVRATAGRQGERVVPFSPPTCRRSPVL